MVPTPVLLELAPVAVPVAVPDGVADELELASALARKAEKVLPDVGALIAPTIPFSQ